jgi:dihydroorotate dehydrogenase (fumarate)
MGGNEWKPGGEDTMIDLSTNYLGLKLKNPIVVSSSPLSEELSNIRKMEDAGASAVVLHSLFEEQIVRESHLLDRSLREGTDSFYEATNYLPNLVHYNLGPEGYLRHIEAAKAAVDIPIIASLNGVTPGGWTRYAYYMQEAGADALELNMYFIPTDPKITAMEQEETYLHLVRSVKKNLTIPVAVKLSPFFTSIVNIATRLNDAGANGLVLFNRFYQPDFDLDTLEVFPSLTLSDSNELRLRLNWIAHIYGHIDADLAITGGIHTAKDIVKAVMAGANVAMMTSALLKFGIAHIVSISYDLLDWLEEHEYESIDQMRGSMSYRSVQDSDAYQRANYMRILSSYTPRDFNRKSNE